MTIQRGTKGRCPRPDNWSGISGTTPLSGVDGLYNGICPTFFGKVIVNLPDGFTSPKRTSATASPVSELPNQTSRMADTLATSPSSVSGRPLKSNKTTGFPVFTSASSKFCCTRGIPSSVLKELSPDISEGSPKAATITSEREATDNEGPVGNSGFGQNFSCGKVFHIGPRSRKHIEIRRIIVAISGNLDTQHTILGSIK